MFIIGMIIIFSTLIYLLVTNNERRALYIFGASSIAYFIFGYRIPLNELNLLVAEANIGSVIVQFFIIFITIYLIERFEDTIFPRDYNLVLRSFFFRFETITLALFLLGVLLSTGNLIIDFLILVMMVRLFSVDKFIAYIVVTSTLFTNALFIYPAENIKLIDEALNSTNLMHMSSLLVAIIIPAMMLVLYVAGFLVRSLEKEIVVEFKIIGIIIVTGIIGALGVASLSSTQMLVYLPLVALILLYLNDLNIRKKFSRFSQIPITLSIVMLIAFLVTIYISMYSFLLFTVCSILLHSVLLNERYQREKQVILEDESLSKSVYFALVIIFLIVILANYSVYNATEIGVPYIEMAIDNILASANGVLSRTFALYTNAAYFSLNTPMLINPQTDIDSIEYLVMAIPALFVISVPMQILILCSTGYKTKISGEVLIGVIVLGLLTMTIVSYAIGA